MVPFVSTRLKLQESSKLHVFIKFNSNIVHAANDIEVTIGGCGRKQLAKNDIRLKVSKKNNIFDLKFLIRHHGNWKTVDKISNKLVPKDYIAALSVFINEKLVFDSHLSRSVSKNPFMHLKLKNYFRRHYQS